MTDVVFYFQVHQPFRLRKYTFFDIGAGGGYFDDAENERIVRRVAERCYLPMNALLLRLIDQTGGALHVSFSISGTALEQLERWAPAALASFQALAASGCAEFLGETSHHSLVGLSDIGEFEAQVAAQSARIEQLFGRRPTAFRNTELVIDERIAAAVEHLGFEVLLGEGADQVLGWRSPRHVHQVAGCTRLKLLLRDYVRSDDIAFRFSNKGWDQWPLDAGKFARWLHAAPEEDGVVGLFMDYETFGEHQWEPTGIFDFMAALPAAVLADARFRFRTPSEAVAGRAPVGDLAFPRPVSWADAERDVSAWLGNPMQRAASLALQALLEGARGLAAQGQGACLETWRKLSTSDHLYYMCTKWFSDGDVHQYFSPYATPHDAFIAFMNVIDDLARRIGAPGAAPEHCQA